MIKQLLTESRAWTHIGQKIETDGFVFLGLCNEVNILFQSNVISSYTTWTMKERISDYLGDTAWAYARHTQWQARAMAAYWLALDTEH